jgi:hypothetical protein
MVLSPPSTALGLNRFQPILVTPASFAYVSGVSAVQPSPSVLGTWPFSFLGLTTQLLLH